MPQFQIITQAPLVAFIGIFLVLGGIVLLLFGLGVIQSGTGQDVVLKFSSGRKTSLIGLVGIMLGGIAIVLSIVTASPGSSDSTGAVEATATSSAAEATADTGELAPTAILDADSGMYDDFDDPDYDRGLKTSLWEPDVSPPSYFQQQNGVMVVSLDTEQELAALYANRALEAGQPYVFEARVLLRSETDPVGGAAGFDLGTELLDGRFVDIWCIIGTDEPPKAGIDCSVYGPEDAKDYAAPGFETETDTWHTIRLEMDSDISMTFYVDGELIGFHRPECADQLQGRTLRFRLAGFGSGQDGVLKADFDDVRISQLGE